MESLPWRIKQLIEMASLWIAGPGKNPGSRGGWCFQTSPKSLCYGDIIVEIYVVCMPLRIEHVKINQEM